MFPLNLNSLNFHPLPITTFTWITQRITYTSNIMLCKIHLFMCMTKYPIFHSSIFLDTFHHQKKKVFDGFFWYLILICSSFADGFIWVITSQSLYTLSIFGLSISNISSKFSNSNYTFCIHHTVLPHDISWFFWERLVGYCFHKYPPLYQLSHPPNLIPSISITNPSRQ